jgi:hypothetical protein
MMSPQQEEIRERRRTPHNPIHIVPPIPTPSIPTPEIRAPKIDDLLEEIDDLLRKKLPDRYDPCKC